MAKIIEVSTDGDYGKATIEFECGELLEINDALYEYNKSKYQSPRSVRLKNTILIAQCLSRYGNLDATAICCLVTDDVKKLLKIEEEYESV